ncbi:succinate dehydrogenase, hydrophobic membrane anchor protein [Marinomonas sp.]|nr:succinate dehydrogenase, hydrophobic membrane anchor protein [Marinomonas sp.]MDB4837674.1 succinate dehydrogenase, hydrophobic membrane anchor protein [Marinomonas sp.]
MGLGLVRGNRSGTQEWIFQRVSNAAIILWGVVYISLLLSQAELTYESWTALHGATWFKLYSTVTLVLAMANSIIAGWQIGTDYTQKVPVAGFESAYHLFYKVVTLAYLLLGLTILWF